jgi:Ran GTPase-activating protein (RanGAP) involved in mRNA processing and transport
LRCALKSVSELSILHLELSDNLLTYYEAKKICKVLEKNPPLRVLNLKKNLLDGRSAMELSKSLCSNRNLLELNLSNNKIGDRGVAVIVLPIAKQRLRALQAL